MKRRYAATTSVSMERSKAEIERTLRRYGIVEFMYGTSPQGDGIAFKRDGKGYKIAIPLPKRDDFNTDKQWEQAQRRRYRVLLLTLKAQLEAVEEGLANFETQFLAYLALPDGSVVGDHVIPEINKAIAGGKKPKLLLPGMD